MPWYAKRFEDGHIALYPRGNLQEFKEVFEAFANAQRGAALFARLDAPDGSATIFLSPAAAECAAMIKAAESSPPAQETVVLLAGDWRESTEASSSGRTRPDRGKECSLASPSRCGIGRTG